MDEWLEKVREAGIVGAGGAGFPAYVKYGAKASVFIANGAECEPLLNTDRTIMLNYPGEIVTTMKTVGEKLGARDMFIAIKKKHADCIYKMQQAVDELCPDIKIFYLDDFYPAGDEFVLVHEITGRVIPPGGIPISAGVCVSNVGTLYNVYNALYGDMPVLDRIVTVNGEVRDPKVINVPVGTLIGECIDMAGGINLRDFAVIIGGPMMGKLYINGSEVLHTSITRTTGGIIVLPKDHRLVSQKSISPETALKRARTACVQCRYCSDMCPRQLMGHRLYPHLVMRAVSNVESGVDITMAMLCSECNACELYACPMGINPRTMNSILKGKMREKGIKYNYDGYRLHNNDLMEYRKVPFQRLIMRLGLSGYMGELEYERPLKKVDCVKIMTKDGTGKSAVPIVSLGDQVSRGQKIGDIDDKVLGVPVYASIDGRVTEISSDFIMIRNKG